MKNSRNKAILAAGASTWRVASSDIVTRGKDQNEGGGNAQLFADSEVGPKVTERDLYNIQWNDRLRTPSVRRNPNPAKISQDGTESTKSCQWMFQKIMENGKPGKFKVEVDPSYSVRNIVRGSGLLKEFGTGYLQHEELEQSALVLQDSENNNSYLPPSPPSSPPPPPPRFKPDFGVTRNALPLPQVNQEASLGSDELQQRKSDDDIIPLYTGTFGRTNECDQPNDASRRYQKEQDEFDVASSFHSHSTQGGTPISNMRSRRYANGSSPQQYTESDPTAGFETIVFQKTVETELYEISDDSDSAAFSSFSHGKMLPKIRRSFAKKRKRRARFVKIAKSPDIIRSGYDPSSGSE